MGLVAAAPTSATTTATTSSSATTTASATTATSPSATTTAPATSRLEIGVADDETAPHQALGIVYLGTLDQRRTIRVDQNTDRGGVDDEVVIGSLMLHAEHVLHASVGAGRDHHPEHAVFFPLLFQQVAKLFRGQVADFQNLGGSHL